jgi:hypothetical protein
MKKARIFIGSSAEHQMVAEALRVCLDQRGYQSQVWSEAFEPSSLTMEALEEALELNSFAVFVFAPNDITRSRKRQQQTVRDNVLFELGLFMGRRGRGSCFLLVPSTDFPHIPSDLRSLTVVPFGVPEEPKTLDGWIQNLRTPAVQLDAKIEKLLLIDSSWTGLQDAPTAANCPRVYPSVGAARPDIIKQIRVMGKIPNREALEVRIIGHRLRGVRELLMELFDGVVNDTHLIERVNFSVFHADPHFLESLSPPRSFSAARANKFKEKMRSHAVTLRTNVEELLRYNQNPRFSARELHIQTFGYTALPSICAYIIGAEVVFLGTFTWDSDNDDFGGPKNPCYRIEANQAPFSRLIRWANNRADIHSLWPKAD